MTRLLYAKPAEPYFGRDLHNIGLPLINRMVYGHCDDIDGGTDDLASLSAFLGGHDAATLYVTVAFMAQRCAYLVHGGDRTKCFHPTDPLTYPDGPAGLDEGAMGAYNFLHVLTHGIPMIPQVLIGQILEDPIRVGAFVGEVARQMMHAHGYAHGKYGRCQWAQFHPENN